MSRSHEQIQPRNGHSLVVGVVARISGGPNQKELSLDDQVDHAKQVVVELYDDLVEYRVIATTGKGERLDRPELAQVEAMLRSRELDLLIAEDIGRIVRGAEAVWLCGVAVDHGTRVIAPNDCIDTSDDSWEEDVLSACRDHVGHNAHTSKRLKQKLMNRFSKFGGAMAREIYGYVVPADGKTYADWTKDEKASVVYRQWFARLKSVPNCALVADWLNAEGVPTGPYSRGTKWDGRMVRRLTRNPVLKGMPGRGFKRTVKHHETGRRVSVRNPAGPTYREYPHLAHIDPDLWDEVNALLDVANKGMGRKHVHGVDPRAGVSRKRTVFPGQHLGCGVCGRPFYWGGHGVQSHMMCSGVRDYRCWNAATCDGHDASRRLTHAIFAEITRLPDFDAAFVTKLAAAVEARRSNQGGESAAVDQQLRDACGQIERLTKAVAKGGDLDSLVEELRAQHSRRDRLLRRQDELRRTPVESFTLPTAAAIRAEAERAIGEVAAGTPEFGHLMRRLVPTLVVYPYQLVDGGAIVLRARLTLDLTAVTPFPDGGDGVVEVLRRELTVDLFDQPQRAAFRERVVELRNQGETERRVAMALGITATAAQRAAALDRLMKEQNLTDPYVPVIAPPSGTKLSRHRHPRYRFESLKGD